MVNCTHIRPDGSTYEPDEFDTGKPADHAGPGIVAGPSVRRDFSFLGDHDQVQASIERIRPVWAAGHIDTVPLDVDENGRPIFSADEIREMYGGEKYVVRFLDVRGRYIACRTLVFKGFPPLVNGVIIEDPNLRIQREKEEAAAAKRAEKNEASSETLIRYLIEQQKQSVDQTMAIMQAQLQKTADPMSGVSQMLGMFAALEKFKGGSGGGNDTTGMIAGLMELLKGGGVPAPAPAPAGFMGAAPAPARSVVPLPVSAPVSAPAPAPAPAPGISAAPAPAPAPVNNTFAAAVDSDYDPDISIADELAGMNDQELIGVVCELLGKLGDERAIKLFEGLSKLSPAGSAGTSAT